MLDYEKPNKEKSSTSYRSKMRTLNERISDLALHLQSLTNPELSPKIQKAVERNDRRALFRICKSANIPDVYSSTIVSVLLSVTPDQKWPAGI
jgi:hypothetical protein